MRTEVEPQIIRLKIQRRLVLTSKCIKILLSTSLFLQFIICYNQHLPSLKHCPVISASRVSEWVSLLGKLDWVFKDTHAHRGAEGAAAGLCATWLVLYLCHCHTVHQQGWKGQDASYWAGREQLCSFKKGASLGSEKRWLGAADCSAVRWFSPVYIGFLM